MSEKKGEADGIVKGSIHYLWRTMGILCMYYERKAT
jgi:hypothetical protein